MALRLNLFHEIARQKQAQRRDPLKLSIYGLSAVAALFAGYYVWQLGLASSVSREYARTKTEFDTLEPQARAAKKREEELATTLTTSQTLVRRIEGRFYWGPVLEQITQLVPREVQITRLAGDVQGDNVKKCTFVLDGVAAGSDPRKVAEDLRTAIADQFSKTYKGVSSNFRSLDDGVETARLDGKQWPTATFAISVQLSTGEEEVALAVRKPQTTK